MILKAIKQILNIAWCLLKQFFEDDLAVHPMTKCPHTGQYCRCNSNTGTNAAKNGK